MSLYDKWLSLIEGQTDNTFEDFWKGYSDTEIRIYSDILEHPGDKLTGTFKELAEKYQSDPVLFMGFLDGIQTSLVHPFELEKVMEDTPVELEVDIEELFLNMLKAEAEHLYSLPQWDKLLSEEKKKDIITQYRKSRTVVKEKEPGRNDPCPCGSGKKYKKCCGANK